MINKATIKGVEHDINDARLPSSLGTAGQALVMNSDATGIEWGSAGGGSEKMYRHNVYFVVRVGVGTYIPRWTIETNSATPFTPSTFGAWFSSNRGHEQQYKVSISYPSYGESMKIGFFAMAYDGRYIALLTYGYSDMDYLSKSSFIFNGEPEQFTDTVTEL